MRRISELIDDLQRVRALVGFDAEVEISVDISTGEEDAEARVFADPIGVQMGDRVVILAEKIEPKKPARRRVTAHGKTPSPKPRPVREGELSWAKKAPSRWVSACGRYEVWVQSRPDHGGHRVPFYGARVVETNKWLTETATFVGAKLLCQEHANANK